jgi:mRNA-degrading endonuclease YafQ of YafQ-DinJ toxin-antitoxin module
MKILSFFIQTFNSQKKNKILNNIKMAKIKHNNFIDTVDKVLSNAKQKFPLSKSYRAHPLYDELENKMEEMYGIPPIITKNSTLGHMAVIPTASRDKDAIILESRQPP